MVDEADIYGDEATMGEGQQFHSFLRVSAMLDSALGKEPEEFEFMQPELQSAWSDAFLKAKDVVTNGDGKKLESLAEEANRAFQCSLNPQEIVPWADILPEWRLKWVFLIRQTVNIIQWTSAEGEMRPLEEDMVQLFRDQIAEPKGNPQ